MISLDTSPAEELGAPAAPAADADPFGLDLAFRERVTPAFRFLHDRYWRIEVSGTLHLPRDGAALLVANHSGGLPFDGAMICTSVDLHCGRLLRFHFGRVVEGLVPVVTSYRKERAAPATRENASRLLQAGELLLIFP